MVRVVRVRPKTRAVMTDMTNFRIADTGDAPSPFSGLVLSDDCRGIERGIAVARFVASTTPRTRFHGELLETR